MPKYVTALHLQVMWLVLFMHHQTSYHFLGTKGNSEVQALQDLKLYVQPDGLSVHVQ